LTKDHSAESESVRLSTAVPKVGNVQAGGLAISLISMSAVEARNDTGSRKDLVVVVLEGNCGTIVRDC
jgi:hypothetical protein